MNILINILVSTVVSCIIIISYMKKIDNMFDEILKEHRVDIKEVVINTINDWLNSKGK